jgi:predicted CXXCH cytochrome family protein
MTEPRKSLLDRLRAWRGPALPSALAARLPGGVLRFAGPLAVLAIGLGLIALVGMVNVTSQPDFCGTCHNMKPYYASWKRSSHRNVACVECHISPGLGAEVRKKFEALSMVAKYFTATEGTKPWAEVDDAACLRCHDRRLLEGREEFHGVVFDHTPHLTETRRGLKLRCTSCHSQLVQGQHIAVTVSTCALCHFKGQAVNTGTGECTKCHQVPEKVVTNAGTEFDHRQVKRLDMKCELCHGGVVRGDGRVPAERCLTCHNEPERLKRIDDPLFLHRQHVTDHKVDCQHCHLTIEHGRDASRAATAAHESSGDCRACHGAGHSPQQALYSGTGGRGVPDMPSVMFTSGVTCQGCHDSSFSPPRDANTPAGPEIHRAGAVSCMNCHGPRYGRLQEAWKSAVDGRVAALRAQLESSSGAMGLVPPKAWEDARVNFLLVERGHGVHNVNYSFALLDKSFEQMNAARAQRGLGALTRPWKSLGAKSSRCMSCHMGVEDQRGEFEGRPFAHRAHLDAAALSCESCHRPHEQRAPGEVVRFGPAGCASCHHREARTASVATCGRCHGDVSKRTYASFRGEFSHTQHAEAGLECANCHQPAKGDVRPPKSACTECHE